MPITPAPARVPLRTMGQEEFDSAMADFVVYVPHVISDTQVMQTDVAEKQALATAAASTATEQAAIATENAGLTAIDAQATAADRVQVAEDAASVLAMDKRYLGSKLTPPAADNQGQPLQIGAVYYDTVLTPPVRTWTGSQWVTGISDIAGVSSINGQTGPLTFALNNVRPYFFGSL
jgi:hypothetical protein